jgi:ADP-heptose:LPS heptosyltransferase
MKDTTKRKNILLIRSATNILNTTIESLKKEFSNSKITVLAPESARESLESHPNVDSVISTGKMKRMTF